LDVQDAEWIRQGGEEATQEEEEEESIPDDFYCPLCDKSFKSQKALANHERSVVMPDGQSPPLLPKSMVGKSMLLHLGRTSDDAMLVCLTINI
jgi:hypothetical protein